jgi:hypothetical protein
VLPMAIEHDVFMAVSLNHQSQINLSNFEDCYPSVKPFKNSS